MLAFLVDMNVRKWYFHQSGDEGGTPEKRPRSADQTGSETPCPGSR